MHDLKGRSAEELIVLFAALICLCGQIPFGIIRLIRGDWWVAGIDAFGAILCAAALYQVYYHRRVWLFGALMCIAAVGGVVTIIYLHGVEDVHFIYPVVVFSYFLLTPKRALQLSLATVLMLSFLLFDAISLFHLSKIVVSLLGCSNSANPSVEMMPNSAAPRLTVRWVRSPAG